MLHSIVCRAPAARRTHAQACGPAVRQGTIRATRQLPKQRVVRVQNIMLSEGATHKLSGPGVSDLAKKIEPFVACNCYYLLPYAVENKDGHTRAQAKATLESIKSAGFNVIRIWAFSDGASDDALQKQPGILDDNAFAPLDWLMKTVEDMGDLKLIMTLTNGMPEYGGMLQYVRWAKGIPDKKYYSSSQEAFNDPERYEFWYSGRAQQYYKDYITQVIKRYTNGPRKSNCIHSWDICNEPRNKLPNASGMEIANWVHETAGYIKSLDNKHPVTMGSEGFFGKASPDLTGNNPDIGYPEGCDWLKEAASPHIDYVSIHTWADQWTPGKDPVTNNYNPKGTYTFNKKWIQDHLQACQDYLGNKPLVLEEFNMPEGPERLTYLDHVEETLMGDNLMVGAAVWMLAHENYPDDKYTIYPTSTAATTKLKDMCTTRKKANTPAT